MSFIQEALQSARETRALELGGGVIERTVAVFRRQFGSRAAAVVADAQTAPFAERVTTLFRRAGHPQVKPFLFTDANLYAEYRFVEQLEEALKGHGAVPVAVGSGTINDLVKLAAHHVERPYLCVATAASMDGYTAFGASISCRGSKQTFHCPAPTAVVADIDIIRAAPPAMNASGYADMLAKVTAGADWILADALGVETIEPTAWSIVQGSLRRILSNPEGIPAGDPASIAALTEGLMLGGFAMQWARSSRPASGAEHQFSHLWDMQHHTHRGAAPSHGFKVGVATLAIAALYERLLDEPFETLDVERCVAEWPDVAAMEQRVREVFAGDEFVEKAWEETRAKHSDAASLRAQLETLRRVWPELRRRLREQLIPAGELRQRLQDAGAPFEPEDIGISRARLRRTFEIAGYIRRRFTVLDVAARTGVLPRLLDDLFGPRGLWKSDHEPLRCH